MLRIEVISNKSDLRSSRDYSQSKISFGRHISNDLILSDPRISRFAGSFEKQSDGTYLFKSKDLNRHFSSDFEFETHDVKIRAHNLGLVSDEITKEFSIDLWQEESKAAIYKWALALFVVICIDAFIYEARTQEWLRTLTSFASIYLGAGILTVAFSLLSRAIERRYNFYAILLLVLKVTTFIGVLAEDLFGLRWVLGSWLWYDGVYYLLFLGLILYFIWQISQLSFSHVKSWIRISVVVICGLSIFTPQAVKFIPSRDNYRYLIKQMAPPLLPFFEGQPKSVDDITKEIHDL